MFIIGYVTTFNKYDKNHFLSIYDFTVKEENDTKIEDITDYEEATKYLTEDLKYSGHYAQITILVENKYQLEALNQLITIAKAWNKIDNFKPDYEDYNQKKYYPTFRFDNVYDKYICSSYNESDCIAHLNKLLCFKTRKRAQQFGKQFEDLFNQAFGN